MATMLCMSQTPPKQTALTFFRNLKMLMDKTGADVRDVSRKSGVPIRTIYSYIRQERTPTVDNADAIGRAFGLTGWQMILPNLKADLVKSGALEKLIADYQAATTEGRQSISRVAETEAEIAKKIA